MTYLEKKIDALARLVLAEDPAEKEKAKRKLMRMVISKETKSPEAEVHELLARIGVPSSLRGHQYLVDAILMTVKNPATVQNMTKENGVYDTLAQKHDQTPSRIERGMRHAISVAFTRGDLDYITHLFGASINPNKGVATNSEFISKAAYAIRLNKK